MGLSNIGQRVLFILFAIFSFFKPPFYLNVFAKQFLEIAFFSLPLVALTSIFSGMVLALQSYIGFARFSAEGAIANVVAISITRELGPVLTALMVAGRVSGAMASEIATMRVGEQIDALYTMSVNSVKFLISPRIIAAIIALPILVLFSDILGIMGGYLVAVLKLGFIPQIYIKTSIEVLQAWDVISGLIKGAVFGLIIASMGCFYGFYSTKGASGVGKATTLGVVSSCVLIFVFDYVLTVMFFNS